MKAVVCTQYGQPDVLQFKEVIKPTLKDNEVLIKIHAASINDWDWGLLTGTPFANRVMYGLRKPKIEILGSDIAGIIVDIGINIKHLKIGDDVYGDLSDMKNGSWGGFAEYVTAPENILRLKPANMSYEQAAAIPQAGALAVQGLLDKGHIKNGQKVLINGASGGVGSLAIQIAKSYDTEVTAVCSTEKMEFVRSLGVEQIIDYKKVDFTKTGQHYDLILDVKGFHSIFSYKHALNPNGIYVLLGGGTSTINQVLFLGPLISLLSSKKMSLLFLKTNKGLDVIQELFEAGKVNPVIDKCYPLSQTREAMQYYGAGQAKGKVVITMEE